MLQAAATAREHEAWGATGQATQRGASRGQTGVEQQATPRGPKRDRRDRNGTETGPNSYPNSKINCKIRSPFRHIFGTTFQPEIIHFFIT